MVSAGNIQDLKNGLVSIDTMSLKEIKTLTNSIKKELENEFDTLEHDAFYKKHIDAALLSQVQMLDAYIREVPEVTEVQLKFLKKTFTYHLNCILDSFTYACLAVPHTTP